MLRHLFLLADGDAAKAVADSTKDIIEDSGASDVMSFFKSLSAETFASYGLKLIGVILLFFVGFWVAKWVSKLTSKALLKAKVEKTIAHFVGSLAHWLVILIVILACLSIFGIETTSVAAVIGAAGLAVGLAFQGTLSNFAAGFMIIFFKPFKLGDVVTVDGKSGGVTKIGLFDTQLTTLDNRRYIIPNSKIYGSTIENVSANDIRRVDVSVGVSYESDIANTRKVLEEACKETEGGLKEPAPAVVLTNLNTSSMDFECRVWCNTPDYFGVREALIVKVRQSLKEANIEIPYQHVVVQTKQK